MNLKLISFINLILITKIKCFSFVDQDQHYKLGSSCYTFENTAGVCSLPTDCKRYFRNSIRFNKPNICYWNGRNPIICCPSEQDSKETFKQKCEAYQSQGVKTESQPEDVNAEPLIDVRAGEIVTAVFNGKLTKKNEFPFMVRIGWRNTDNNIDWRFGGTLISRKFVLTAAHGLIGDSRPDVLSIGSSQTDNLYNIRDIIIHHKYNPSSQFPINDIALIKLDHRIEISDEIRPACIWFERNFPMNKAIIIGYGQQSFGGISSSELLKGDVEIYDGDECPNRYSFFSTKHICAGDLVNKTDTCQGDSGGPLLISDNGNYNLIGITSFGSACGTGVPAVYVRVYDYLDWISRFVFQRYNNYNVRPNRWYY